MVEVSNMNNTVNNNSMHYGNKPIVGVIPLPDKLPSKVLFSAPDAFDAYNKIEKEIYQGQRMAKPKKKGLPKIIKIALGVAAVWLGYIIAKPSLQKIFKKLFKK